MSDWVYEEDREWGAVQVVFVIFVLIELVVIFLILSSVNIFYYLLPSFIFLQHDFWLIVPTVREIYPLFLLSSTTETCKYRAKIENHPNPPETTENHHSHHFHINPSQSPDFLNS